MTEPTPLKGMNPLPVRRFQPGEYARVIYYAVPEAGTPISDLKKPEYWAHVADKLKASDRIEVEAEDGSYFLELLVRDVGRTWAKVDVLREKELDNVNMELSEDLKEYDVMHKGKIDKWCVIRLSDKSKVFEGGNSKQDAVNWLTDHLKALAA